MDALGSIGALGGDFRQLRVERRRHKRRAAKTSAANRPSADREVETGIVEAGQDGLLDLIERQLAAADPMRQAFEGARDLPQALCWIRRRLSVDRIVVDNRLQDERVVGIQPERDLIVSGQLVRDCAVELGNVPIELAAINLQRMVVDEPVTDVGIENLIENHPPGGIRRNVLRTRSSDQQESTQAGGYRTEPAAHASDYTRCVRKRARASLNR